MVNDDVRQERKLEYQQFGGEEGFRRADQHRKDLRREISKKLALAPKPDATGEQDFDLIREFIYVKKIGVDGLKLHPLHVVKHTVLAQQWRRGEYQPLTREAYIRHAADLIERTPEHIIYHRVTGTASKDILLAPDWCSQKWNVLNGIERELARRSHRQGQFPGTSHELGALMASGRETHHLF